MSHDDVTVGSQTGCAQCHTGDSKFEATPILADGRLYLSTPWNRIIALDPVSGEEIWRHDPHIETDLSRAEGFISRGVSYWEDSRSPDSPCGRRIFMGTVDAELLSLDAATGTPCRDFGRDGAVALDVGVGEVQAGQYGVTSPPAIVGDVVVVGSSVGDNRRVDLERGTVRGYDARTGELIWDFDPIPRDASHSAWDAWTADGAAKTGAANTWAPIAADVANDMVFVPTGSAAPDFYGGERPGSNLYANSVVALKASTGEVIWHFQVVHHDLWDYDVASQPSLIDVPKDGSTIAAVAVATKMGFVYLLDRTTGEPIYPVEERPVPESDVPGEVTSPTQPFPTFIEPLHPLTFTEADVWGATPEALDQCMAQFRNFRSDGIFTPPSVQGTLMYPGNGGGINWGGTGWDPERDLLVVNMQRTPFWVRLMPRPEGETWGSQLGTPYSMIRAPFLTPDGVPCYRPPWGTLAAVDLRSGRIAWEIPFGYPPGSVGLGENLEDLGSPNIGGPVVTAGGIFFIAATMDSHFRAYDTETGAELWAAELPAGGQATPMTYELDGKQYVVIAAGGHPNYGGHFGDYVVAYALP
jgi:quinoprotein glucose dehydrogenase